MVFNCYPNFSQALLTFPFYMKRNSFNYIEIYGLARI